MIRRDFPLEVTGRGKSGGTRLALVWLSTSYSRVHVLAESEAKKPDEPAKKKKTSKKTKKRKRETADTDEQPEG